MFFKGRFCQGILALAVALAVASCSHRLGLAERRSHDVSAHDREEHSHSSDCTHIAERVRIVHINDTVRVDSIIEILKWRWRTDTILIHDSIFKVDSIYIEKKVDQRNFIQKTADKAGNICLLVVFIIILVKLLKIKRHDNI